MPLQQMLTQLGIKGSFLIAPEGMNATLAGTRDAIDTLLSYINQHYTAGALTHKESLCDYQPFNRGKVRLKKEIISLGEPASPEQAGIYADNATWNALLDDPDVIVLDTRNSYETHLGTFARAIDPNIANFKQLPDYVRTHLDPAKHKKIATFCTGGIRCEKFTAWMKEQGFEEVYHLQGGILKYLEEVPEAESKWQGECYVFDQRVAVTHGLIPSSTASMCLACGHALTPEDRLHPTYMKDESCPFCA